MTLKYQKILKFAEEAHKFQKRKYTDEPYIVHPIAVAELVKNNGGDENMVLAALLHDVLEDTNVTHSELRAFLHQTISIESAEDVLSLVVQLTDVYTKESFPFMNRKERKGFEALRLSYVSDRAKVIKRADIEHNTDSIVDNDPKFAKVFLAEKEVILNLLNSNIKL